MFKLNFIVLSVVLALSGIYSAPTEVYQVSTGNKNLLHNIEARNLHKHHNSHHSHHGSDKEKEGGSTHYYGGSGGGDSGNYGSGSEGGYVKEPNRNQGSHGSQDDEGSNKRDEGHSNSDKYFNPAPEKPGNGGYTPAQPINILPSPTGPPNSYFPPQDEKPSHGSYTAPQPPLSNYPNKDGNSNQGGYTSGPPKESNPGFQGSPIQPSPDKGDDKSSDENYGSKPNSGDNSQGYVPPQKDEPKKDAEGPSKDAYSN